MLDKMIHGGVDTSSLRAAKENKNDEFYTRYEDVENEIIKYVKKNPNLFYNKVVYCPCDDYGWSNFVKFFVNNFSRLGIKKLISTCKIDGRGKKFVLSKGDIIGKASLLSSNGDFRNEELRDYFTSADIIVTNPPFSIIGDFYRFIKNKKFIMVCPIHFLCNVVMFPDVMSNDVKLGGSVKKFLYKDKEYSFNNTYWCTNITNIVSKPKLHLRSISENTLKYGEYTGGYSTYDDSDIIDIPTLKVLPNDYYGIMGVPVTILSFDYEFLFDVVGKNKGENNGWLVQDIFKNKKEQFIRVFIKRKK